VTNNTIHDYPQLASSQCAAMSVQHLSRDGVTSCSCTNPT